MIQKSLLIATISTGLFTVAQAEVKSDFHQPDVLEKIAFASCYDQRNGRSPMFEAILKHKPDVFVFLGDAIYGDTEDMDVFLK
jgi:alkaline phosphatase D